MDLVPLTWMALAIQEVFTILDSELQIRMSLEKIGQNWDISLLKNQMDAMWIQQLLLLFLSYSFFVHYINLPKVGLALVGLSTCSVYIKYF